MIFLQIALVVAVVTANEMRVDRIPSNLERMMAAGTWAGHRREIMLANGGKFDATADTTDVN